MYLNKFANVKVLKIYEESGQKLKAGERNSGTTVWLTYVSITGYILTILRKNNYSRISSCCTNWYSQLFPYRKEARFNS